MRTFENFYEPKDFGGDDTYDIGCTVLDSQQKEQCASWANAILRSELKKLPMVFRQRYSTYWVERLRGSMIRADAHFDKTARLMDMRDVEKK